MADDDSLNLLSDTDSLIYECWLHKLKGTKRKTIIIGSYPWRQKYFIIRIVANKPILEYYKKYPHAANIKPRVSLQLWPAFKVEKISNTKNRACVFEVTTTERRLCLSAEDQLSMDHFVFMLQIQTKLIDDVTDDYFTVKPDNCDACRRIRAENKVCLLHVAPWGVTLALKESRAVLAQWPIKSIRSYESSGGGIFQLDVGRIAPLGDGLYTFHTSATQDDIIYDLLDKYVSSATNENAPSMSKKEQFREYELESNRLRALTTVSWCTNERALLSRVPSNHSHNKRNQASLPPAPSPGTSRLKHSPSKAVNRNYIPERPTDEYDQPQPSQPDVIPTLKQRPTTPNQKTTADRQSSAGYLDMSNPIPGSNRSFSTAEKSPIKPSPTRDLIILNDQSPGLHDPVKFNSLFTSGASKHLDLSPLRKSSEIIYENSFVKEEYDLKLKDTVEIVDLESVPKSGVGKSDNVLRDDYNVTSLSDVSRTSEAKDDDYIVTSRVRTDVVFDGKENKSLRDDYAISSVTKRENDVKRDDYNISSIASPPERKNTSYKSRSKSFDDLDYTNMSVYENVSGKSRPESKISPKDKPRKPFKEIQEFQEYVKDTTKGYIEMNEMKPGDYETVGFKEIPKREPTPNKAAMRRSVSNPNFFKINAKNFKDTSSINIKPLNITGASNQLRTKTAGPFKRRHSNRDSKNMDDPRSSTRSKFRPRSSSSSSKGQPDFQLMRRSQSTESFGKGIFSTPKTRAFSRKLPVDENGKVIRSKSVDRLNSRDSFGSDNPSLSSPSNPNHGRRLPSLPDDTDVKKEANVKKEPS